MVLELLVKVPHPAAVLYMSSIDPFIIKKLPE